MDRMTRLLGGTERSKQVLEIGAGYSPVAPKAKGWLTHVVDHTTQEALRQKYISANVDTALIEAVDTVWEGGTLHEAVPQSLLGQVDLIIASHVLEHMPDLIGFFISASRLVRPGGVLSVALPDRRYCFDCFKPWTTTGELLEAHHRGVTRHGLRTAFDAFAYSAVMDGQLAWCPRPVGKPSFMNGFEAAREAYAQFRRDDDMPYQDHHAWQFTPMGFKLIMLELGALGVTDWAIETLHGPENFEFFVSLRRVDPVAVEPEILQSQRRDLLLRQMAESREQIDFILGGSSAALPGPVSKNRAGVEETLEDHERRLTSLSLSVAQLMSGRSGSLLPWKRPRVQ